MANATKKNKRVTIVDVAKEAGVSVSTVSHVLNGSASISEATKKRVHDVIQQLQYYPNTSAKALRSRKSNLIGLIVRDLTSQYYSIAYDHLLVSLQDQGYHLYVLSGKQGKEFSAANIDLLITHQAEGVIVLGSCVEVEDLERARKAGMKVVLGDQYSPDYPCVEWNNYISVRNLVHALANENRKIAYVHSETPLKQASQQERLKGYMQGMRDEGRDPDALQFELSNKESRFFAFEDIQYDRYVNELRQIKAEQWPDVIMCEHDVIAQAIVISLMDAGIRVPEDIQVIGFDDTSHARLSRPQLTTIRQDPKILAESVFTMMCDLLNKKETPNHICLEQTVIIRDSANILEDYLQRERLSYKIKRTMNK